MMSHSVVATETSEVLNLKPNFENGAHLYQLCAACHGSDGFGQQQGEFPSIAGQHQSVLIKQIIDIQTKKRSNPTMYPFTDAKTLGGNQGLADVTAYIAAMPANTRPIKAEEINTEAEILEGRQRFERDCVGCHGANGEGKNVGRYPRLIGQHYPYMVREVTWIREGVRKNGDPAMVAILQDYSDANIASVVHFITTLSDD